DAAQNKRISKLLTRATFLRKQSQAAGDPMTGDEAIEGAVELLRQTDPDFKALAKKADVAGKRQKQISIPPNRRSPVPANTKANPNAKAIGAINAWRQKNK